MTQIPVPAPRHPSPLPIGSKTSCPLISYGGTTTASTVRTTTPTPTPRPGVFPTVRACPPAPSPPPVAIFTISALPYRSRLLVRLAFSPDWAAVVVVPTTTTTGPATTPTAATTTPRSVSTIQESPSTTSIPTPRRRSGTPTAIRTLPPPPLLPPPLPWHPTFHRDSMMPRHGLMITLPRTVAIGADRSILFSNLFGMLCPPTGRSA
mmetsp:Transcript_32469/g.70304  ORF Transcript_32469/g.70304 Transcript_32469/m.70304 type:complete len:207 (-) Transcript_32469:334-954(-)